jgi:uncharacterized RDD family membrane protein YckC
MVFILFTQWILLSLHFNPFEGQRVIANPALLHLWVFATVTFPIFVYFSLTESSRYKSTIGKKWMHLQVETTRGRIMSFDRALMRNVIKLLPWEASHFVLFYLGDMGKGASSGYLLGNIVVGVVCVGYLLCLFSSKDHKAVHDVLVKTQVVEVKK